ncbi:MAG TPA: hypothetical protein VK545_07045, partial [Streptomyces sp.]|nr:hypothetical protein [Streptomyces sp.]
MTGARGPLPWPERKPRLVPSMPQRAKFGDHVGRQAGDPSAAGDRCASRVPHHKTMIDDQEIDASPPTV